jgi:hypothetical protein
LWWKQNFSAMDTDFPFFPTRIKKIVVMSKKSDRFTIPILTF